MVPSANDNSHPTASNVSGGVGEIDREGLGVEDIVPDQHICFQTVDQV